MWQRSLIPPRTSSKFSKYFRGKRSSFIHRQRVDEWCLRKRKFEIPSLYVQILNLNKWWQLINQVWPMPLEYKQICSASFPVQRVLLVTWKDAGGGWSKPLLNRAVAIQKGNLSLLIHKPSKTQEGPFHCFDVFGSDYGLFSTYPKNKVLNTLLIATKSHLKDKTLQAMRMLSPVSTYCEVTIKYQWLKSSIEWENVSSESFNMMMIV